MHGTCRSPLLRAAFVAGLAAGLGCAQLGGTCEQPAAQAPLPAGARDAAVYRAAKDARVVHLEREVARLRADLHHAEEEMVTIESGLRGRHARADAVSTVADARIAVARAAREAPWRPAEIEEAQAKIAEAELQLEAGHSGSALFFASRAARIAEMLNDEAAAVSEARGTLFVEVSRANLRSGPSTRSSVLTVLGHATPVFPQRTQGSWMLVRTPSGPAGWLHASVLEGK
jgi:hypothetical protein